MNCFGPSLLLNSAGANHDYRLRYPAGTFCYRQARTM